MSKRRKYSAEFKQEQLVVGFQRALAIRECLASIDETSNTLTASKQRQLRWVAQLADHYDPLDTFSLPRYQSEPKTKTTWSL